MGAVVSQGDGTHLATGSIQAELLRLRARCAALSKELDHAHLESASLQAELDGARALNRRLVGLLRDLAAPLARAVAWLDGAPWGQ